jgi:uncharacterized SAM-binding protein YcdF (DUF218 family)
MRGRRGLGAKIGGALAALLLLAWLGSLAGVLIWSRRDQTADWRTPGDDVAGDEVPAAHSLADSSRLANSPAHADAIVVLGAAQYVGRPSPVLQARLDHAIALYDKGLAPKLVLTGGTGVGDTTSEAAVGRKYVLRHGVPDSAIVLENRGRTTSESLRAVARFMEAEPGQAVILVSDPFHMLRLSILARRFGMTPYTSPTRTSPIDSSTGERWKYVLGESVKVPLAFLLERKQP